ncbi:MAG TPA: ABC transporter permease, partial [Burkholderiales bacterium]|nr:ABC transporter permease [Burkholderiales bacterium]
MTPLKPVGPGARVALGAAFFVLFFAAWALATLGGYVSPTFLADPATMVREGWNLLVQHGFIKDILITIWRVFGGFLLAAAIGIPLGMAMGAYKPIE